jgi:hypothetical protein
MTDRLKLTPDLPIVLQGYASTYSGVDLAPHRLNELMQVAGLLVDAVNAQTAKIALGDDPHTFARALEALREQPKEAERD